MEDRKQNPKLLTTLALAGALFTASTWLISLLPVPRLHTIGAGFLDVLWVNSLRFVVYFAPLAIGITLSLWAERRLKRGIQEKLWNEAQLEPARALLANPIWNYSGLVLLVAVGLYVIMIARGEHRGFVFIYIFLFPLQTATRLRVLLTPPRARTNGVFLDWGNFKPIHSDHWGQPPVHPSE